MKFFTSHFVVGATLVIVRVISVFFAILNDCDEVYNYLEPVHFLTYGTGFQTWEYSPEFALRSYSYAGIWSLTSKFIHSLLSLFIVHPNMFVFYAIRFASVSLTLMAEITFARALSRQFGRDVRLYFLLFQLFSTGAFQASVSILPSSSFMIFSMWVWACLLEGWLKMAVLISVFTTCATWPFAGVVFVPFGLEVLRYRGIVFAILAAASSALLIIPLWSIADIFFYGRWTSSIWNVIAYNTGGSGGGHSELYGVEPWHYYIKNSFLMFNVLLPILVMAPIIALKRYTVKGDPRRPFFLVLFAPIVLWFTLMSCLPHKEERFLYPLYPLITAIAAITVANFVNKKQLSRIRRGCTVVTIIIVVFLSLSRTIGLVIYYNGVALLWQQVATLPEGSIICSGNDWYRFHSSFFLPPSGGLEFLEHDFKGILPAHFNASDVIPPHMNNLNREEPSRYVSPSSCDYIAGILPSRDAETVHGVNIEVSECYDVLDAARSPAPWRSYWLPNPLRSLSQDDRTLHWQHYCLARVKS